MKRITKYQQAGSIIVSILIMTLFLTTLIFSLMILANTNLVRSKSRVLLLEAQYAAESGADAAIAQFNNGNDAYTGSGGEVVVLTASRYKATFSTTVSAGSSGKEKIITSTGRVYAPVAATTAAYSRKIRVTAQRSTAEVSTSMLSRNIIDIASGVKNIWAVDVYANGYINMNKNTTYLTAENISVASKNTGASNCSIGGAGNLLKPTSFSHAGQTKTNILTSYNNCLSPPGNASNSNFNVTANSSVNQIASTYIAWSQYMDSSYQNSPGGCSDWTVNGANVPIPSAGNAKKTHYPDSGNNVSTSCGTSGNLDLGSKQYNISDNVHVRANLCATSACDPTFNNTTSTIKFIFVEGTVNFQSLQTAAGSGPLVIATYGADPNSHGSACPSTDGDSIYLGQHGGIKTIAPALYLLAKNGLCVDQTKFDNNNPSLGGLSGKNLYIASNPGNPYDLVLDPSFPVSQIPIDLAWRAVRYQRI